jgi:hypothetical protein
MKLVWIRENERCKVQANTLPEADLLLPAQPDGVGTLLGSVRPE